MKSVYFDNANIHLDPPDVLIEQGFKSIYANRSNSGRIITKWKPTFLERLRFLFLGSVWLTTFSGETQAPVTLSISRGIPRKTNKKFSVSVPEPNRRRRRELIQLNKKRLLNGKS